MPAIITSIMFIILFVLLFFLIDASHNKTSLQNKSYCIGGGIFLFSMLGILPELFVLIGALLFIISYFEYFHMKKLYSQMILSLVLSLLWYVCGAEFLLIVLLPELFDLSIYSYNKYKKRAHFLVFGRIETRQEIGIYNGVNICMLFFSLSIYDYRFSAIIFLLCLLLNWYFYKRIDKLKR